MSVYHLTHGQFIFKNRRPDGDTLTFLPSKSLPVSLAYKQIRLENIDAPELHFLGRSQPPIAAKSSLDALLSAIGAYPAKTMLGSHAWASTPAPVTGWVAYRSFDTFRRAIAYVFPTDVFPVNTKTMSPAELPIERSANFQMLADGKAFPMFFSTSDRDHRFKLTDAAQKASIATKPFIRDDVSRQFQVSQLADITEHQLIYPRLFRRLISYAATHPNFDGFGAYLKAHDDYAATAQGRQSLSQMLEIEGNTFRFNNNLVSLVWET